MRAFTITKAMAETDWEAHRGSLLGFIQDMIGILESSFTVSKLGMGGVYRYKASIVMMNTDHDL